MISTVEARKLNLPPRPSSFLFDPNSLSLALILPDSSISIFSPFSPFSSTSLPPPKTLIPAPSSSACFLRFNPNSLAVFIAVGPSHGDSKVLIRFLIQKQDGEFVPARVKCAQRGIEFDRKLGGVVVDCFHGLKVVVTGSVNYFAMYSASAAKVWVFGVKSVVEDHLGLVKCAVIDCQVPVTSMSVSSGFLILGEVSGVRVFPLRLLVKGSIGRKKKAKVLALRSNDNLRNGFVGGHKLKVVAQNNAVGMHKLVPNGVMGSQIDGVSASSVKPKSQRLSQESNKWGAIFLPFSSKDEGLVARKSPYMTKKAISIHVVMQNKFLVVDSDGDVHILCASVSGPSAMKQLSNIKEVQQIAVLPGLSESSQTVWLSDGNYSVHVMAASDTNTSSNANIKNDSEDMRLSVVQTIFVSESIRDVQPLTVDAILILGQDNLYAYAIS